MAKASRIIEGIKTGQRYIVQVRAKNSTGLFGPYSNVVEITTSTEVPPRAPTDVVLAGVVQKWTGTKYKLTLTLTWTPPIEVVKPKYEAILEEWDGEDWVVADMTNAVAAPQYPAVQQKWVDYTPSGQYRARIRAISQSNSTGTWCDYATCTTVFASDLPTPTGLSLKQDGKQVTAIVNVISQTTYPQLAGYRFYASKQTGFTPNPTNLIGEAKSTTLTFQEAANASTGILEEIVIGNSVYVRVSSYDAAGNESNACAEVSIVAGGNLPNAPTSLTLTPTLSLVSGRKYQVKTVLTWTAPTNVELSGYDLELYEGSNGSGVLQRTSSPTKNAIQDKWTDNAPNQSYSARIRAINKWGRTGGWSSWANAAAVTDTTPPPVPTSLVLTQDGKKVTARWAAISQLDYPDFKGFRVYAAKVTGFTPGPANMVYEGRGTSKTIQEAANASTGILEEIVIGNSVYVRVSSYDEAGNESNACAEVSIVAGGNLPNAPTSLTLTLTVAVTKGRIYNVKANLTWTPPSNVELSGYELELYAGTDGSGVLQKTLTPGKNATSAYWTDNDPNQAYSAKIRAINKWGRTGSYSTWTNANPTADTEAPGNPGNIVLAIKIGKFEISFLKSAADDVAGYKIYVWTSNNSASSKIIDDVSHPGHKSTINVGKSTYSGSGDITIGYNTPYFFWVTAYDKAGNENATKSSSNPTNDMIFKGQELIHFSTPWKMSHLTSKRYRQSGGAGTTTYTVPSGKCALIAGYKLYRGAAEIASISINGANIETESAGVVINRRPQLTNGMYAEYGDYINLLTQNATGYAEARIKEFDSDPDISVIVMYLSSATPYTVTSGKTLFITFIFGWPASQMLQIYEETSPGVREWIDVYDIHVEEWNVGKGILQIPSERIIRISPTDGSAELFGVEIKN